MYKGISVSPLHGSFAPGVQPGPSDLEYLVSGRQREVADLLHQAELQSVSGVKVDIAGFASRENVVGNSSPFSQNVFGSGLVFGGGVKRGA